MAVKIVTDSTSYIPVKLKNQYDIYTSSLSVAFEDESFKEVDIDNKLFYKKMEKANEIPKSSQPSIEELYNIFENIVKLKNEVVGIFISSEMSGTYSTAKLVRDMIIEKYPQAVIELIDSRSNCMQLGYAVLTAARAAKEGKCITEVVLAAEQNIESSRFIFIPDGLEYLRMGGRIGGASALLGSILQIKPILTVAEGKTTLMKKVRTKKRALKWMIEKLAKDTKNRRLGEVIVHHINCEDEAKLFAKKIEGIIGKTVEICSIGPVIGLHVGPGAIGIVYYTEK